VSVRYPSSWKSTEGAGEGVWYRTFHSPTAGQEGRPAVAITLLAGPTGGTLDQYAQSYLKDRTVSSARDSTRQGVAARSWRFATGDGALRYSLLLLQDAGHVWGVFTQAEAAHFEPHQSVVEEMETSLTLERPQDYTAYKDERYGFTLRVPSSWRMSTSLTNDTNYLKQFISPSVALDKKQELGASLTVTAEPAPPGGLDAFHAAVRKRLGDSLLVLTSLNWRGGKVEMARTETPLAVLRVKRYYWTSSTRGYTVACEGREDVFPRVTRWCDVIVSTLEIDGRPLPPEEPAAAAPRPTPAPALIAR
jgi:hypothetical protein